MKRKRVLIDASLLLIARTGIRTYIEELVLGVRSNAALSHDYRVPGYSFFSKSSFFYGKLPFWKKVLFHAFYSFWKQVFLPLYSLFKGVDVILIPDYIPPLVTFGKRLIVVFHDVFYWEHADSYKPLWRVPITRFVEMALKLSKATIVADSHYSAEKVKRFVTDSNPVRVVYLAPKSVEGSKLPADGLPGNYFLHVGTLEKRKNLMALCRAFVGFQKTLPSSEYKLLLVGGPSPSELLDTSQELADYINKKNLKDQILLKGYVPDEELPAYYENCDAYVFPSHDEGFGLPLVEAMRFGKPCIISNNGSLPEIAADATLIWKDGDPDTLAAQMMEVVTSAELRKVLSEKAFERAKDFSSEKFVEAFEALIGKPEAIRVSRK